MSYPWEELLPQRVELAGEPFDIRSDYRDILNICAALNDPELSESDKVAVMLTAFYEHPEDIPPDAAQEAVEKCLWFINCGEENSGRRAPKLVDWEQDFRLIVAPVNRVLGKECRSVEYLHWWTFVSAYYEIGDCLFAQVVRVRSLKARGKPLEGADKEFYRDNRALVDFKAVYTEAEKDLLRELGLTD